MINYQREYNLKEISYAKNDAICKFYIETTSIDLIKNIIKEGGYFFIGNTSKTLFCFKYKEIKIIKFISKEMKIYKNLIVVDSGMSLSKLGNICNNNGISGFEKLMTIPGLLGGSIFNNASFLEQCISDNLLYLLIIDKQGNFRIIKKEEVELNYRKINIKILDGGYFIYKAIFKVKRKSFNELLENKLLAINYRIKNQPQIHSLGSTFKNLSNIKIYQLIDKYVNFTEYNGYSICQTHKNFIELRKDLDILNLVKLIERIQGVLYNNIGLFIETEIKIIY